MHTQANAPHKDMIDNKKLQQRKLKRRDTWSGETDKQVREGRDGGTDKDGLAEKGFSLIFVVFSFTFVLLLIMELGGGNQGTKEREVTRRWHSREMSYATLLLACM